MFSAAVVCARKASKHNMLRWLRTTLLSCTSLLGPSSCSLLFSPVFSRSKNSHRHWTGRTSSEPSEDWTSSASHGILCDAPWNNTRITRKILFTFVSFSCHKIPWLWMTFSRTFSIFSRPLIKKSGHILLDYEYSLLFGDVRRECKNNHKLMLARCAEV